MTRYRFHVDTDDERDLVLNLASLAATAELHGDGTYTIELEKWELDNISLAIDAHAHTHELDDYPPEAIISVNDRVDWLLTFIASPNQFRSELATVVVA